LDEDVQGPVSYAEPLEQTKQAVQLLGEAK